MTASVTIRKGRVKPLLGRHPWIFAGSIAQVDGEPADGDVVDVLGPDGSFLARGLFSGQSQLRVRAFAFRRDTDFEAETIGARLDAAIAYRRTVCGLPSEATDGYRLVHAEGDGLPGLVVDVYGSVLVVQLSIQATDRRRDLILDLLTERLEPTAILEVSDPRRKEEGLPVETALRRGELPERLTVTQRGLVFPVQLAAAQKTGLYFDQRDNHARVEALAEGRTVLDGFCYRGGFALAAARGGATSVLAVDSSGPALAAASEAGIANALYDIEWRKEDVFKTLGALRKAGETRDLVILDPPSYAQRRNQAKGALKKHTELARLGLQVTAPGGIAVFCCCSGIIDADAFERTVRDAAAAARRHLRIIARGGQAADHPTSIHCPEGRYLEALFCHVE